VDIRYLVKLEGRWVYSLHEVSHPALYQTVFTSPQLELIGLDEAQWSKIQRRSLLRRMPPKASIGEQFIFAGFEISTLIFYVYRWGSSERKFLPTCVLCSLIRSIIALFSPRYR
jgi:hypothetical protein